MYVKSTCLLTPETKPKAKDKRTSKECDKIEYDNIINLKTSYRYGNSRLYVYTQMCMCVLCIYVCVHKCIGALCVYVSVYVYFCVFGGVCVFLCEWMKYLDNICCWRMI